jgi:hypothetical protein
MRRRPCQITAEALDFKTPLSLVHSVALARSLRSRCLHPRVFYIMVSKQSFRCCRRIKAGGRVTGAKGCKLGAYIMKILAAPPPLPPPMRCRLDGAGWLRQRPCAAKYKGCKRRERCFHLHAPAALQCLYLKRKPHFSLQPAG